VLEVAARPKRSLDALTVRRHHVARVTRHPTEDRVLSSSCQGRTPPRPRGDAAALDGAEGPLRRALGATGSYGLRNANRRQVNVARLVTATRR
jgi:hypothetical protein